MLRWKQRGINTGEHQLKVRTYDLRRYSNNPKASEPTTSWLRDNLPYLLPTVH